MTASQASKLSTLLEISTHALAGWAGSSTGFLTAIVSMVGWFVAGEVFHFSTPWENALSVYIGVITFLMIFVMQRSQRKELQALHIKLNELVAATGEADNRVIDIETHTEGEISEMRREKKPVSITQESAG